MNPVDTLKKAGYKITRPRRVVINILLQNKHPRSARDIHTALKRSRINLTSVYRSLELFEYLAIAFSEERNGERYYYLAKEQHHHITCRKCQRTECLPCKMEFKPPAGFINIEHQLTLTGLCKKCI